MKKSPFPLFSLLVLGASFCSAQSPIDLSFANLANQAIRFDSNLRQITFDADNVTNRGLEITSSNQTGLEGLFGAITGSFTIGTIANPFPGLEIAPLTGAGLFKIFEPNSSTAAFTADLHWVDIATFGTAGVLNTELAVNFSNFQYTGSYAPLTALLGGNLTGTSVVSFQFLPERSLTQLTDSSGPAQHSTSFSGSVLTDAPAVLIPEPSAYAAMIAGVILLGVMWRSRRSAAKV